MHMIRDVFSLAWLASLLSQWPATACAQTQPSAPSTTSPPFLYLIRVGHRPGSDGPGEEEWPDGLADTATPSFYRSYGGIQSVMTDRHWERIGEPDSPWDIATFDVEHETHWIGLEADWPSWFTQHLHPFPSYCLRHGFTLELFHLYFWIYRVAPSPHIISFGEGCRSPYYALDGIPWSQVQAYRFVNGSEFINCSSRQPGDGGLPRLNNDVYDQVADDWHDNPDYDARWERFAPSNQGIMEPGPSSDARGMTRRQLAWLIMRRATDSRWTGLEPGQVEILRGLLNWHVDREPNRDFPLIQGPSEPRSLQTQILRQLDWGRIDIPAALLRNLVYGIPTVGECMAGIRAIHNSISGTPRPPRLVRRRARCLDCPTEVSKRDNEDAGGSKNAAACSRLQALARKVAAGQPPRCARIDRLVFELQVSDEAWAGTTDAISLIIGNNTRSGQFKIAENFSRGDFFRVDVDLERVFGSSSIALESMRRISIRQTPAPHPLFTDDWKLRGLSLEAHCAEPDSTLQMRRFADNVNRECKVGVEPAIIWHGTIGPEDWQLKTKT